MVNVGRILTLSDGREYAIAASGVYNNKTYVYIVNIKNKEDLKICSYENDELEEVTDEEFINKLAPILLKDYIH